jgi:hypothetical protein
LNKIGCSLAVVLGFSKQLRASIMPRPVLETLTLYCITNEAYRTVLTIWVWPWLREDIRGFAELLEFIDMLKPFLLPMMQLIAVWMHWQILNSNIGTPWYAA